MPEAHEQASPDRRASWVALRTLRQRPKVVDRTAAGEPIYEIQSVRLLLPGDASHFHRLVTCSRCNSDVVGAPVQTAADLSEPAHPVICKMCSQMAARPAVRRAQPDRPAPPAPAKAPAEPPAAAVSDTGDSGPMAAIEAEVRELTKRMGTVGKEWAARVAELEDRLDESVGELAVQVQDARTERAATDAALAEVRSEMDRVAESARELARGQLDLKRDLHAALTEGLAQARAQEVAGEDQLQEKVMALVEVAVTQRIDVTQQALKELQGGRDRLEDRLDDLATQVADGQARVDALASSMDATVSGLHVREQTLNESVKRLTSLLEDQTIASDARTDTRATTTASGHGHSGSAGLLESLERQLREAERRMAQHTVRSASGDMTWEESLKS